MQAIFHHIYLMGKISYGKVKLCKLSILIGSQIHHTEISDSADYAMSRAQIKTFNAAKHSQVLRARLLIIHEELCLELLCCCIVQRVKPCPLSRPGI